MKWEKEIIRELEFIKMCEIVMLGVFIGVEDVDFLYICTFNLFLKVRNLVF